MGAQCHPPRHELECAGTGAWQSTTTNRSRGGGAEAGESKAATIIYLPAIRHVAPGTVTLQPEGEGYTVQPIEGSPAGYMIIPPVRQGNRSLFIAGKQPEG
ncbi:hypothetical protein [Paenibacillus thiaminolyticus]|uniref:hypothetical protein n=1 Tax=Paenibacillus thiaminolyticus TaxID=49283 RepID=UPI0025435AB8|nr:hypothetical protein [Paenibacillus thiaminolyticus]WII38511.1 hypothetical protein O0V01_05100 [Paenibacillus thiaminolyticus]